jgi:TfoX/Sxy family transcriptional regulator of competence genes
VNEALAARMRRALADRRGVTEKRMFGGVCFLLKGNMLCGMGEDKFMIRVGKDQDAAALARPGAKAMDFTGRAMKGFVWVDPAKCDARALKSWIAMAQAFVGKLPAKQRVSSPRRGRPR